MGHYTSGYCFLLVPHAQHHVILATVEPLGSRMPPPLQSCHWCMSVCRRRFLASQLRKVPLSPTAANVGLFVPQEQLHTPPLRCPADPSGGLAIYSSAEKAKTEAPSCHVCFFQFGTIFAFCQQHLEPLPFLSTSMTADVGLELLTNSTSTQATKLVPPRTCLSVLENQCKKKTADKLLVTSCSNLHALCIYEGAKSCA